MIRQLVPVGLLLCGAHASGAITLQLTASPASPQPVGTPISWTVAAVDEGGGSLEYQFSAGLANGTVFVADDYSSSSQYIWETPLVEGAYTFQVTVRNRNTSETASAQVPFTVAPRFTGGAPVITPTTNPLVALYSAPACPLGSSMFVGFGAGSTGSYTNLVPCNPASSTNFYIAGMLPKTTYNLTYFLVGPSGQRAGPTGQFTTGALDPSMAFPVESTLMAPSAQSSQGQGVLLLDYLSPGYKPVYYAPTALDLQGRVIWYYPALAVPAQVASYFIRPITNSGGHMLLIIDDPATGLRDQILEEIDLAGNTVQQTTASRVSEQLLIQGKRGIIDFDHDAVRLPNGHTLVICSQEEIFTQGTQGSTAPVDILDDAIVDLDENMQVAWSWSGYDHLNIARAAVLNEVCVNENGCPPFTLAASANDWMHANSLNYIPSSGDILLSVRNQDWVIKIDYANGTGSGNILWTLGNGGDFRMNSTDPFPWFSHQHDVEYELDGTAVLSLFDNGNTRAGTNPGLVENSRGYVLSIDESAFMVTPILLADLGVYSPALGSAQRLLNGNYFFEAGSVGYPPDNVSLSFELLPDGTRNAEWQANTFTYRGYRMTSLYNLGNLGYTPPAKTIEPPAMRQ